MGVAIDSFVMTVEYAGIVAIVLLVYCFFSRHRNDSGGLNLFQRMPVLLPALGFVITVMMVANLGFTPMSQYQGLNSIMPFAGPGFETDFTLREQYMYSGSLDASASIGLELNESTHVEIAVYQNSSLVDTLSFDIQYDIASFVSSNRDTITLEPGTYNLQLNYTVFFEGTPIDDPAYIHLTISQPLIAGFTAEIVDWSTYQFALNIGCIFFIIGGFGIGSSTKKPPKVDETDWKTTTEYEY